MSTGGGSALQLEVAKINKCLNGELCVPDPSIISGGRVDGAASSDSDILILNRFKHALCVPVYCTEIRTHTLCWRSKNGIGRRHDRRIISKLANDVGTEEPKLSPFHRTKRRNFTSSSPLPSGRNFLETSGPVPDTRLHFCNSIFIGTCTCRCRLSSQT